MIARIPSIVAFLLSVAALILCFPAPLAAQTLVVAPFENSTTNREFDWVSEAFAESLTDYLAGEGVRLIAREERANAMDRLGLALETPLTRASLVRLGEELNADWVAVGEFDLEGDKLMAWAQVLNVRDLKLSPPVEEEGAFSGVQEVAAALAWQLRRRLEPPYSPSWEEFRSRLHPVAVSAFESYLRGLLSSDRSQQTRYWLQAARLEPEFSAPAYRLGRAYLEEENYAAAVEWLEKVPLEEKYGLDARFHLALAMYERNQLAEAIAAIRPLAVRLPVEAVWNNLAVFASRAGAPETVDFFQRALAEDRLNPDLHFNLGLHYFRNQREDEAANQFFSSLELNPADTEARFLLAKALEAIGRLEEARSVEQQAVGDNPALIMSLERRKLELDRVVTDFSSAIARRTLQKPESRDAATPRARHVEVHLERGAELMGLGELEDARDEFVQAILLSPDSYLAHLRLAEIYQKQERAREAIAELHAALWSRDTAEARVQLALLFLEQGRNAEARQQAEAALAVEPGNAEAKALAGRLGLPEKKKKSGSNP